MFKIFLYDIFKSSNIIKITIKLFSHILLYFIFAIAFYLLKTYFQNDFFTKNYNALIFITSFVISIVINYNPSRILFDATIHKSFLYKLVFMFFNFFFSLPSIFFLSAQSIFFTNFSTFFINYFILLFATLCTLCFDKHFFVKILILLLNAFLILLNHIFLTSLVLIFYITFYLIFNKQCFDEYKQSQIKNNLIEKTYNHNAKTTSIITELLFLLRAKKSLFFTSIFCSFGALGVFKYLNVTNPAILNNLSNIRLLLLFCLMTSSFIAIFGPYMMNWFYFYADDYLSKNWTIKTIIESKIDLLKILTLLLYILILPFIIFFKLNLVLNTYFFIMNISITISVALIISITEISKIDTTQSPRLNVEKGSLNSSFLSWICELIPIIIIKIFYPIISLYYILIASIIIFGIFHLLNERIIQKFTFLVNKKLSNRSMQ